MRIYRYRTGDDTAPRIALAAHEGHPIDAERAGAHAALVGSGSTLGVIEAGPEAWAHLARLTTEARGHAAVDIEEAGFRWLCPLDRAASLRDFLTFESHVVGGAERRGIEVPPYWYEAPVYYKGNHRTLIGPDDECPWPSYTERLDFELELAMVVGRRGRDISAESAGEFIFGFTILDDFSARDIQAREMSAWLGPAKGKDFATGLGPCIVTVDDLGPAPDLAMVCRVNGEEWGRARSSEMFWSWTQMIEHVSRAEDVHPGDVYGSGTPGGCCGLDLGRTLNPGDIVELEIEGIGTLRNTIGFSPKA